MALIDKTSTKNIANLDNPKCTGTDKLISLEECKKFIGKYDLSDQKVMLMRNTLIGIADKTISSYLNEFI
ncbi:MAG: hypothetical protein WC536_04825 [Patescibacteria group bacterium]